MASPGKRSLFPPAPRSVVRGATPGAQLAERSQELRALAEARAVGQGQAEVRRRLSYKEEEERRSRELLENRPGGIVWPRPEGDAKDNGDAGDTSSLPYPPPADRSLGINFFLRPPLFIRSLSALETGVSSPAQQCGLLRPGDRVLAINGVPLTDLNVNEIGDVVRKQCMDPNLPTVKLVCVIGEGAELIERLESGGRETGPPAPGEPKDGIADELASSFASFMNLSAVATGDNMLGIEVETGGGEEQEEEEDDENDGEDGANASTGTDTPSPAATPPRRPSGPSLTYYSSDPGRFGSILAPAPSP
ncbi:hypothetical protein TeGR_g9980, partial [Tetraparma gracilis]